MESLFQFLDEMDDFVVATALRLQRSLSRRAPERRRVYRPPESTAEPPPDSGE